MNDSLRLKSPGPSSACGHNPSAGKHLAALPALVGALLSVGCSSSETGTSGANNLVGGSASQSTFAGAPALGGALGSGGTTSGIGEQLTGGTASHATGGSRADTGGAMTGGAASTGGSKSSTAGTSNGGAIVATGGASATGGNPSTRRTGGASSTGGSDATGGRITSAGGATASGSGNGGTNAGGGRASGGTSAVSGGGSAVGGLGTGGTTGNGGGTSCPFPTTFKWTSSGPLAQPKSPAGHEFVSLKDFTHVFFNNQHIVYASVFDKTTNGYSSVSLVFKDWPDMASANQTYMNGLTVGGTVAPTIFYFTPKSTWVLITQWGLSYATGTDPADPAKWSARKNLLSNGPKNQIDPTVICDATNCYLFHAGDDGNIYRSSMPIGNFPGTFSGYQTILTDTQANLFEAVQVYSVKGTGEYLMIVEAMGSGGRFFRGFRASTLGGTWTAISGASTEATPFAGKKNVTFSGSAWTNDISHGDMIRSDPNETQPVDPCNMQLLYQGRDPSINVDYGLLPYRPGLLTKTN